MNLSLWHKKLIHFDKRHKIGQRGSHENAVYYQGYYSGGATLTTQVCQRGRLHKSQDSQASLRQAPDTESENAGRHHRAEIRFDAAEFRSLPAS